MSEPVEKKGRIRSSDIRKLVRDRNETKYDFKKILQLKGPRRDKRTTGRPAGVASQGRGNQQPGQHGVLDSPGVLDSSGVLGSPGVLDSEQCSNSATGVSTGLLTEEETYCCLLKEKSAVHCIDDQFLNFVLQDFDSSKNQLKALKYLNVSRRPFSFLDGDTRWIYHCSCNNSTKELIECCEPNMEVPFSDFKARIGDCLHTSSLAMIMEGFDAQNQITPEVVSDDNPEFSDPRSEESLEESYVLLKDGLFGITTDKGFGVIQRSADGYKCLTCQVIKCRCIHLAVFLKKHGEDLSPNTTKAPYKQKCYSVIRIPFNSTDFMIQCYKKPLLERFPEENGVISLKPEEDFCMECHCMLEEAEKTSVNIFAMHEILQAIGKYDFQI